MDAKPTHPTTFGTWARSLEMIRNAKGIWIRTGIKGIFLPYLGMVLLLAWNSQGVADNLKEGSFSDYSQIMAPASSYFFLWIAVTLTAVMLMLGGFFSFIHIAVASFKEAELSDQEAYKKGLDATFPKGLAFLLILAALSLEQVFLGPFRIVTLFGMMAAVIMVVEKKGVLGSFRQALLFKYSSPLYGGGLSTAFVLAGLSALVFTGEYGLNYLYSFMMYGDDLLGLPRDLWTLSIPGMPFSAMFVASSVIYGLGITFLAAMTAGYLVCLFFGVRSRISHFI